MGLGVDQPIDHFRQRFEDLVSPVDVVLETVGGDAQLRSWNVLRKGGVLVSIVTPPSTEEAHRHEATSAIFASHPDGNQLARIAQLIDFRRVCLTAQSCPETGSSPACGSLMSSDSAHRAHPSLRLRAWLSSGCECSLSRRQKTRYHAKLPYAWHTRSVNRPPFVLIAPLSLRTAPRPADIGSSGLRRRRSHRVHYYGFVRPAVETVLPLSQAKRAQEMSEAGHVRGKIVLSVD